MSGSSAITPPQSDQPEAGRDGFGHPRPAGRTSDDSNRGTRTEDPGTVLARQKERFGGMKAGSAFFGWLTATGTTVILLGLVAAIASAVGSSMNLTPRTATDNAQQIGLGGAIVLIVVIGLAYFSGGYVAGRMARFHGARQGVGVWLWALIITVVVAVVGLIAGNQFNVMSQIGALPRIPINRGTMTLAGIISLIAVAVVALAGAVLGGLTGMRYHRRIDRADLTPTST
jgi:amino acid transporter